MPKKKKKSSGEFKSLAIKTVKVIEVVNRSGKWIFFEDNWYKRVECKPKGF